MSISKDNYKSFKWLLSTIVCSLFFSANISYSRNESRHHHQFENNSCVAEDNDDNTREMTPFYKFYRDVRKKVNYIPPNTHEIFLLKELAKQICASLPNFSQSDFSLIKKKTNALGLEIKEVKYLNENFITISEYSDRKRGWGAYIFRTGSLLKEIVIQAPHTYYDQGTGIIALSIFEKFPIRAFYFNTVHRGNAKDNSEDKGFGPADVAHNFEHPFSQMTYGLSALKSVSLFQIHGFGGKTENDLANIVLSTGDSTTFNSKAQRIAAKLSKKYSGVKRYPQDTNILGATTNVQGKLLRQCSDSFFLHIEMSKSFRDNLLLSKQAQLEFGSVITDSKL